MTGAEVFELLKNFSGVISSALVFFETEFPVLPLNPKIREDSNGVAAVVAVIAGFGAHQYAKRSGKLVLGGVALGLALVTIGCIFWLAAGTALSPHAESIAARVVYVLLFVFLGSAVGGFLR